MAKASYDEANTQWHIELEDGSTASARFLISATGPLSAYTMPRMPGVDSFKGDYRHTACWPEGEWTQHVDDLAQKTLFPTADSWFMGVNPNNPDAKRTFMLYAGGAPHYKAKCDDVTAHDYAGFALK